MSSAGKRAVVVVAAMAAAASTWLACSDDARSHVYTGREFDETRHCLEDLQSIDVVAGPEPETSCAPVCVLSLPDDSGASLLYVSTMCPPYPIYPYDSDAGGDPRCAEALVAYQYDTSCELDGAVLNLPKDASAEAEASADANADGNADASVSTDADADANADANMSADASGDAGSE